MPCASRKDKVSLGVLYGQRGERSSLWHPNLKYLASSFWSSLEPSHRRKLRRMYEWQTARFTMVLDLLHEETPGHFKRLEGSQAGRYGPVLFCQVLDLWSTLSLIPKPSIYYALGWNHSDLQGVRKKDAADSRVRRVVCLLSSFPPASHLHCLGPTIFISV